MCKKDYKNLRPKGKNIKSFFLTFFREAGYDTREESRYNLRYNAGYQHGMTRGARPGTFKLCCFPCLKW